MDMKVVMIVFIDWERVRALFFQGVDLSSSRVMRGVYYGLLPQLLCPPSLLLQIEIQGSLLRAAQAFQSHLRMAWRAVFD